MTVYVARATPPYCFLWADTEDEAIPIVYSIGLSLDDRVESVITDWVHYYLTNAQYEAARKLGCVPTDRFGPRWWIANRDCDSDMLARITEARVGFRLDL